MADIKHIAVSALIEGFGGRDPSAFDRYFTPDYIQHNPTAPNGSGPIKALIGKLPPEFKYEQGLAVAEGDLVMVQGRYSGLGPTPLVAVDIFRFVGDKIVEHWDVMQGEVPAAETASGNPMFTPV